MTNHIDEAFNESEGKSAFVCVSCGHKNIVKTENKNDKTISQVNDQFTEAVSESSEKSAFICESCRQLQPASS